MKRKHVGVRAVVKDGTRIRILGFRCVCQAVLWTRLVLIIATLCKQARSERQDTRTGDFFRPVQLLGGSSRLEEPPYLRVTPFHLPPNWRSSNPGAQKPVRALKCA